MDDIVTGTDFISTRQRVNESYGSFDYDSWVMSVIKPEQGDDALDLGCGTGKHARTLSRLVGTGTVVGVDKSPKSVAVARSLCGTEKLCNVQIVACGVDMVPRLLDDRKFDIILASYSIYYSADQVSLMRRLAHLLEPLGRLFVTGNGKGNNRELVNFINNLSPAIPAPVYRPFITAREIECAGSSYRCYTVYHKTNKVAFPSCMEITEYWRASSLYRLELDGAFEDNMAKHFEINKAFVLTKRILGVLFYGHC